MTKDEGREFQSSTLNLRIKILLPSQFYLIEATKYDCKLAKFAIFTKFAMSDVFIFLEIARNNIQTQFFGHIAS